MVEHEGREPQQVVAVEVRQKEELDRAGVDAQPVHVRQQWRAAIEQDPAVHHHGAVVALLGEGGPAPQEGKPQDAMPG